MNFLWLEEEGMEKDEYRFRGERKEAEKIFREAWRE